MAYVERDRAAARGRRSRSTRSTSRRAVPASSTRGPTTRWAQQRRWRPPAAARARGSRWWTRAWTWPTPSLPGASRGTYDVFSQRAGVADRVGHGTFVAGLIAAVDGNGIGGKGVAGNTRILAVRASRSASTTVRPDRARDRGGGAPRRADHQHEPLRPELLGQPAARAPARLLQRRASGRGRRQQRAERKPARVPRRGARRRARPARHRPVGDRHAARRAQDELLDPQRLRQHRRAGRRRRPVASSACSRSSRPT